MSDYDIVVVGSGPAGITAAVTACARGQKVAVVEAADRLGGTGLGSAYGIWVPRNRHLQALDIEDDRTECLKLMCRNAFPEQFDEGAEHYGVPAEDYRLFEAYYDNSSEMLDLFEKESGILSRPMLNHSRDFDTYDRTREVCQERGMFKSEELVRFLPDYHAEDPYNRAPVGRYLTFGPGVWSALMYYLRILFVLGWKAILRSLVQLMNPFVLIPMLLTLFGKHREGVYRYAGSGVRVSRFAKKYLRRKGVRVALGTKLNRILLDDEQRVRGIEVQDAAGKTAEISTRNVVLCTGGFNYDPEKVAEFAAETPIVSSNGIPTCTGAALTALDGVKPKLGHMHQYWLTESVFEAVARDYPYDPYASYNLWYLNGDSFLVVDQHGKRCLDESLPYSLRAKYYKRPDKLLTFLVYDRRCYRNSGGLFRYLGQGMPYDTRLGFLEPSWLLRGKDTAELKEKIAAVLDKHRDVLDVTLDDGFAEQLDASIERYNGFARAGVDEDFQRGSWLGYSAWLLRRPKGNKLPNKHMYPLDPSHGLYAVVLCASCFSTKGGLAIDGNARVLREDGAPIPGLYAAGNCSASPTNVGYVLSTIGPAMTFGYLAAQHAAGAGEA
ncbi:MAG: FAD-dependent oxidoreductase [bacterium]